jgi:hypothetical protein
MKSLKCIALGFLIALLCFAAYAEKRKPRLKMKELTDPNSPNYVPYPYPKNRKEIIEDLKYHYGGRLSGMNAIYLSSKPFIRVFTNGSDNDNPYNGLACQDQN